MNGKLKTVPLNELLGDPRRLSTRMRIGILVFALLEALVLGTLVWRALY